MECQATGTLKRVISIFLVLHFVQGTIAAGWEQGVMIPESGYDRDWLRQHFAEFQKRAENGEEEMKELIEDIEKRKLIEKVKLLKRDRGWTKFPCIHLHFQMGDVYFSML